MDYSLYLQGSPVIPWKLVVLVVFSCFFLSTAIYFSLTRKKTKKKLKLFGKILFFTSGFHLLLAASFATYLFLPSPQVNQHPSSNFIVNADTNSKIEIVFTKPVSRRLLEKKIEPDVPGVWLFEDSFYDTHLYRRLVFYPDDPLLANREYKITLRNITNVSKISPPYDHQFIFKTSLTATSTATTQPTIKLAVPAYLQQHALSCEVAALRMTLAYRGVTVSEETLLNQVGYDPTPHKGNVWGNPYQAFVGNVDGRQMTTGYGVYWEPIARVGQNYRPSTAFEGWTIEQLTQELINGNPVIIWVYAKNGTPTSWYTPTGEKIYAVAGEHTVVVVGFTGPADNPTKIIVNDPLIGQVYWSRATFEKKWNVFNHSGVVVR